ncbi:MAG TPA: hypothetical protein VIG71_10705 [Enteractinococcus sp.]
MLRIVNDDEQPLSPDEVNQLFNDNRQTMRENLVDGFNIGMLVRKFLIGEKLSGTDLRLIEEELDRNIENLVTVRNMVGEVYREFRRTTSA